METIAELGASSSKKNKYFSVSPSFNTEQYGQSGEPQHHDELSESGESVKSNWVISKSETERFNVNSISFVSEFKHDFSIFIEL